MADVDKARDLLMRTAYDYGREVWLLLRAGLREDAEDCAYDAWAAAEAAKADDPWARWKELSKARHDDEEKREPRLRLVVDNTRLT